MPLACGHMVVYTPVCSFLYFMSYFVISFHVPKKFHILMFQGGIQAGSGKSSTCFLAYKSRIGNTFNFITVNNVLTCIFHMDKM